MILQLTSLFKAQTSGFGDDLGPQDRPASEYRFPVIEFQWRQTKGLRFPIDNMQNPEVRKNNGLCYTSI